MEYLKFTTTSDKSVYIRVDHMTAFEEDASSNTVNIKMPNGYGISVKESIPEILAILEGRDPKPAKILYGRPSKSN